MDDPEKLEKVKIEIRSLLISFPSGCSLSEFRKTFQEFLGKKLPSQEFGFRSDADFLGKLHDVVHIIPNGRDFHLYGIADEKSQHIQKLVCKQKNSKKPSKISRSSVPRNVPPRFARRLHQSSAYDNQSYSSVSKYENLPKKELIKLVYDAAWDGISLSDFPVKYQKTYRKPFSFIQYGFSSLRSCIESIPELVLITRKSNVMIYERRVADKMLRNSKSKEEQQETSKGSSVKYDDRYFSHDDRWVSTVPEYSPPFGKESTRSSNAFDSGANVNQDKNKDEKWAHTISESSFQFGKENTNQVKDAFGVNKENSSDSMPTVAKPAPNKTDSAVTVDKIDTLDLIHKSEVTRIIPENIKIRLKKVAVENPQGIFAKDFLSRYEGTTLTSLNLHNLGYSTLHELIDDVPDIFVRKPFCGNKKDWIIYPVDSNLRGLSLDSTHDQVLAFELIKCNIRAILEGYPEGVKLQDFIHLYSLNCNEPLCLKEFSFDSLEQFLLSIADSVPLIIESSQGCQMIHLLKKKVEEPVVKSPSPQLNVFLREDIPIDAVLLDAKYTVQDLPEDLDQSKFFPIYTSSISNPNLMYIQLRSESVDLNALGDDLDNFYKGFQSEKYKMKNAHIKTGAVCAALWPCDQLWYRAQILSITSLEFVKVFYVDYGTTDEIPTTKLRYLKKEFFDLPAQALRSQLAYVKPKNGATWPSNIMSKLLNLCRDKSLMAKIQDITENGILSLVICDTTGDQDFFINDALINEGLADVIIHDNNSPRSLTNSPGLSSSPIQNDLASAIALQAQFLQAWAVATGGTTAPNASYGNLVKQMSMLNLHQTSTSPSQQVLAPGLTVNPFSGAVAPDVLSAAIGNPYLSAVGPNLSNPLIGATSNFDFSKFSASGCPITAPQSKQVNKLSNVLADSFHESDTHSGLLEDFENDIFDDDDELFQQFCSKVEVKSFPQKRFVKRVDLSDGYTIHLIIHDSKPFSSGGDISTIIWINKDSDFMNRMLQAKEINFGEITVSEDGNDELFRQLDLYKVKGVQKITGSKSSVLLYPFANIIKILNLYGHPSLNVRVKLIEEISHFNLAEPIWQETPDEEKIEDLSNSPLTAITDDDKITQMCFTDLMAMKEGIFIRRIVLMKRLRTHASNPKIVDEVEKMDQLLSKVLERMKFIKSICDSFS